MLLVLDTDVIVAGLRSRTGASAEIIRRILRREIGIALSVALVLEYEAVITRPEHLKAASLSADHAVAVIDALAFVSKPVETHFRWRPQLHDPDDEMVLETAVNGGATAIVTFNKKDFGTAAEKFGIRLAAPVEILRN